MSDPYSKRKRYALDVEAWIQFKLLRLAAFHPETTKADITALAEIIQRYWGRYGNGFVSDQEICDLTGLTERTVRRARKNLARLGFVTVVRAGGRGHATVYTPNFGMVQKKEDIPVLDKRADIPVLPTDENVRLNGELQDRNVRPSYLQTGLQTGHLKDRPDCAAPTAPAGAGPLGAAPPDTSQEASLPALLAAYSPADMSKPARAAYKRAWEAINVDTDLATVIAAAHDWHQAWAQQNNPDAPRMGLVRWLKDEMYLKPAPKGFNKSMNFKKGEVVVAGGRIGKIVRINRFWEAEVIWIDSRGQIISKFFSSHEITPLESALRPRSLWPDSHEGGDEVRTRAPNKSTKPKPSKRARASA